MLRFKNPARLAVVTGLCASFLLTGAPGAALAEEQAADLTPDITLEALTGDSAGEIGGPVAIASPTPEEEFMARVQAGGTVDLESDVTLAQANAIPISKDTVIDLNGHALISTTTAANHAVFAVTGASLTIKDSSANGGSFTAGNCGINMDEGATVNIESGLIVTEQAAIDTERASNMTVNISGGIIKTTGGSGALVVRGGTNNVVNMTGGEIDSTSNNNAVSLASGDAPDAIVFNMSGGTISRDKTGGYVLTARGAIVNLSGTARIEAKGTGCTAIALGEGSLPQIGTLNISGQAVVKSSAQAFYTVSTDVINISGGTISYARGLYGVRPDSVPQYAISGGTFLKDGAPAKIDEKLLVPGYKIDPTTGTVAVDESKLVRVEQNGKVMSAHAALAEAIAAAPAGSTVKLLGNISEAVTVPANSDIVIDLNGHTLSDAAQSSKAVLTVAGKLALIDSAATKGGVVATADSKANSYVVIVEKNGAFTTDSVVLTGNDKASVLLNRGTIEKINGGNLTGKNGVTNDNGGVIGLIEGVTIETTGVGIKNNKGATLTSIKGCVVTSGSEAIIQQSDIPIQAVDGGTYKSTGDYAISVSFDKSIASIDATVTSDTSSAIRVNKGSGVVIAGGFYTSAKGKPVFVDSSNGAAKVQISGGTFSAKPNEEYFAPGFGPSANSDGTFGVHEHAGNKVEGTAPTCTEPGVAEHWKCASCGDLFADEDMTLPLESTIVPATGHNVEGAVFHAAKEPTATEDGHDEYWECPACHALFADAKLVDETTLGELKRPALGEPEVEKHTVTFVYGFSADKTVEVEDGKVVAKPDEPVHEGWKFLGWFTVKNADNTLSGEYDFSTPVEDDLTLYAGWAEEGAGNDQKPEPGGKPGQKPGEDADKGDKPADGDKPDVLPSTGDASMIAVAASGLTGAAVLVASAATRRRKAE